MRVATIDVGTNTALLLIAGWKDGALEVIHTASGFVRLGEGLDASGAVSQNAIERLRNVLTSHMAHVASFGIEHVIVTGTSASRDARNADALRALVREITGAEYTILSGDMEAEVTFEGAVAGWSGAETYEGPVTVIDVGGGSTELVEGRWNRQAAVPGRRVSLNMGSVRVTERFLTGQPASEAEWNRAVAFMDGLLDSGVPDYTRGVPMLGASGTAILLGVLQARRMDPQAMDPISIPVADMEWWDERVAGMSEAEVLALEPKRMIGRSDVFPAGVRILLQAMRTLSAPVLHVSRFGVRHGVAIRYLRELSQ